MRDMHAHALYVYSASVVNQVDEALCFDSIVCGHHICKAVWTPQKAEKLLATSLAMQCP